MVVPTSIATTACAGVHSSTKPNWRLVKCKEPQKHKEAGQASGQCAVPASEIISERGIQVAGKLGRLARSGEGLALKG